MIKSFVRIAMAAAIAVAAAGSAGAQVQTIDPNQADAWRTDRGADEQAESWATPQDTDAQSEWTPIGEQPYSPPAAQAAPSVDAAAPQRATVPRDDVFNAAENVFGRGAEGVAAMIETILRDQGEPIAYISGREAGGAFVFGVRYGSGTMRHQIEGDREVYWTGPSLGFDFGADAGKVFVLVYNLYDSQDLFRRYPGAEGKAYVVGGLTAQYLRRGDVVLIPIRMGVGLRLGVNAGYMRFTENNRWLPF